MAGRVWGIDLGTTYSCIARVNEVGRPEVISNSDGQMTTPSVVLFSGPDSYQVGMEAKNQRQIEGSKVCELVKRRMGQSKADWSYDAFGVARGAPEISALILRALAEDAERTTGEPVERVVVTVPAWFGDPQRAATREAGEIAGLEIVDLINEPTAAAIAYGFGRDEAIGETVIVYDLGGGTFDATGMRVEQNRIRMLATQGDHQLGGADWDLRLTEELARKFVADNPNAGDPLDDPLGSEDLRARAEDVKRALSSKEELKQMIFAGADRGNVAITREEFERATADLLDRTLELTQRVLEEMRQQQGVEHIDGILLVGGSSFMPAVKRRLEEEIGVSAELANPNLAVAGGAALYGEIESIRGLLEAQQDVAGREAVVREVAAAQGMSATAVERLANVEIVNICSRGFGIELLREGVADDPTADREDPANSHVDHLVRRNTELPAVVTRVYHPVQDDQRRIHLIVREQAGVELSERVEDNDLVVEGDLPLPEGARRSDELNLDFEMTKDGRVTVDLRHPRVPEPLILEATTTAAMSPEELSAARQQVAGMTRAS